MNLKFIIGAASCGKTSLAQRICYDDIIISLDAFSKSIRTVFPNFQLYSDCISVRPSVNGDIFFDLVSKYINCFVKDYPDKNIIIEGCHFTPQEIFSEFPNAKIVALGITDKSKALLQIDKKDWMSKLDNSVKLRYAEQIVEYSLRLKNNADNYLYLEFNDIERNEEKCLAYFAK